MKRKIQIKALKASKKEVKFILLQNQALKIPCLFFLLFISSLCSEAFSKQEKSCKQVLKETKSVDHLNALEEKHNRIHIFIFKHKSSIVSDFSGLHGYYELSSKLSADLPARNLKMNRVYEAVFEILPQEEFKKLNWLKPFHGSVIQFFALLNGFFDVISAEKRLLQAIFGEPNSSISSHVNLIKENGKFVFKLHGNKTIDIQGEEGFARLAKSLFPRESSDRQKEILLSVILSFLNSNQIKQLEWSHFIPETWPSPVESLNLEINLRSLLIMPTVSLREIDKPNYFQPAINQEIKEKIQRLKKAISQLEENFSTQRSKFIDKNYKVKYQKELNSQQLEVVQITDEKTLVIAGPGTGKTRTLVHRTSFLIENGIDSNQILILTFTKKAAESLKQKVNTLLDHKFSNQVTSGTFHSFSNRILSKYSRMLNISPRFTILDQEDSRDAISMIKKELGLSKKNNRVFPGKAKIQGILSASRNLRVPIWKIIKKDHPELESFTEDIIRIEEGYEAYKRASQSYDYDDLIDEMIKHLKTNLYFRRQLQKKYKYIMVDEYQDTNLPQKELIDWLSEREDTSLMVVGDDNQSIYSFRGANYENILLFGETYTKARLIKLEQNYRSSLPILKLINELSDHITLGYKKSLFTENENPSPPPEFIHFQDEEQEATFIADKIIELQSRMNYNQIAVLSRTSRHSNSVQVEFLKRNIPFKVVGGIKFIDRRHIKDILAHLKLLWNPLDALSWYRVLELLDEIGNVTAGKVIQNILKNPEGFSGLLDLFPSSSLKGKLLALLYQALTQAQEASSLITAFKVIEEYYSPILKNTESDWMKRVEDFKVLERLCHKYKDIESLLSNLALDPPNDSSLVYTHANPAKDAVTVSTIHSAKGMEWNTVFVISLIDGALPHVRSFYGFEELEEERRLLYVAASRAKEHLFLTSPHYSYSYQGYFDRISRFIYEILNSESLILKP